MSTPVHPVATPLGVGGVCDTRPVRRHTYRYFSNSTASLPCDKYQIIPTGDKGTCVCACACVCVYVCVWTTCRRLLPESGTAGSRTRDLLSRKSASNCEAAHLQIDTLINAVFTPLLVGERSIVMRWWACLSVCLSGLSAIISQKPHFHTHEIFCACCLWPWLGLPPAVLQWEPVNNSSHPKIA